MFFNLHLIRLFPYTIALNREGFSSPIPPVGFSFVITSRNNFVVTSRGNLIAKEY
jgi:hypothetical protein